MSSADQCKIEIHSSVTVGSKGQVVIPKEARTILNIKEGDKLVVITKGTMALWLIKADDLPKMLAYLQNETQNQQ